jgi:hypothetical protein
MKPRHIVTLTGFCLALMAFTSIAFAQGSGTIQGTVTDPTGAVIPQAAITAVNVNTGVETARVTTAAGLYVLSPLAPGEYTVKVSAVGFQTVTREHLVVEALATIGLNIEMKVGSANEQVTVEAVAPTLHTEDVVLGQTMQNNVYNSLPLAMGGGFGGGVPRDPTQFIALAPGVAAVVTQSAGPSYTSFNGAQQETNGLYLEGMNLTFANQQGDTRPLALGVSVEAIEQFQVEVNGQKAQYQGQGFHNYQLKSGTNQFHGAAYEYFRNTTLDARGFFSAFVPPDRQNEFGGNFGGPIKKNRVFFFGNYTGYYYNTATAPIFITLPPLAARNGDFSGFAPIYDPGTQTCNGAICSKQIFPNNTIPANRISPVSKSFQSYLPTPTTGNITNNYLASLPRAIHNNNTTDKVDVNLSDKDRFYGVFVRGKWATDYTGNLTATGTALPLPYTSSPGIVNEITTIGQLHHTHVFTPAFISNLSVGATRLWIPIFSTTADGNYVQKAGLTGLPTNGFAGSAFPTINFNGVNAPSNWGGAPFDEAQTNYVLQDNFQWVRGKHVLGFGAQLQFTQNNDARPSKGSSSTFSFSNNETAGFSPTGTLQATQGNAYASYLLGAVNSATITNNNVVWAGHRYRDYSFYFQDDWKITSKISLNLGLRWDVYRPYREQYDRFSYLDPNKPNPAAAGRLGALVYGGNDGPDACHCRTTINTHYRNFQPRAGIAYAIDSKTVLRTSFNMAYTHGSAGIGGNGATGPGRTGYNLPASYSSAITGQPAFNWDAGVPAVAPPAYLTSGFGVGFTTSTPTGALSPTYVDPELSGRPPYYINWAFGLQRELPGSMTVGATYSASVGHFLPRDGDLGIWTNSMLPRYLVLGALLGAQATPANLAAAQAIVPGIALPFANYQGTISQMLKPFPQYSGLTCYSCDLGNSTYHSLQVTLNRRFAQGLTTQISYTLSKEIDNLPSGGQLGTAGGTRDPYNGVLDRALGVIHRPHLFRGSFLYLLPFGKGRLGGHNAVVRALAGGWSISGLITFNSGPPLSITGSGCTVTGVASTCIASYNPSFSGDVRTNGAYGSGNALQPGAVSYLDKRAFVNPAPYTFGDLPRSAPFGLAAQGILNEDISVRREVPIRERLKFAIGLDVFNVTNSVYFAAPGTNIDSANFGQVQTASNSPRKLQINARITF